MRRVTSLEFARVAFTFLLLLPRRFIRRALYNGYITALQQKSCSLFSKGVFEGVLDARTHVLIPIPMDRDLVALVDRNLAKHRYTSRSQFVRDAIAEKLRRSGVDVPDEFTVPRPRTAPKLPVTGAVENASGGADKYQKIATEFERANLAKMRRKAGR